METTSIEQAGMLMEMGIDPNTSDMCFLCIVNNNDFVLSDKPVNMPYKHYHSNYDLPCWSVECLLGMIPSSYQMTRNPKGKIQLMTWDNPDDTWHDSVLDAVLSQVSWYLKNDLII